MPLTTTSNLTLGSILDAIPSAAAPPHDSRDQPGFGSLLRPPTSDRDASASADRSSPQSALHTKESQQEDDSAPALKSATSAAGERPADSQDDDESQDPLRADVSPQDDKSDDDHSAEEKPPHASEDAVAASAAALAIAVIVPQPAAGDKSVGQIQTPVPEAVGTEGPKTAQSVFANAAADLPSDQLLVAGKAVSAAEPGPLDLPTVASETQSDKARQPTVTGKTFANAASGQQPQNSLAIQNGSGEESPSGEAKESKGNKLTAGREKPETQETPTAATAGADQAITALPADASLSPTTDPAGPRPPAPPTAAAAPVSSIAAAASAQSAPPHVPSRLSGEALVQGSKGTPRRGVSEAETARLLGRVARAFSAAQPGDGEIRLRLSPPELGSLRLQIQVNDGALVARLETETSAARTALIDNLPALRERLAEQGVRIERFDVDLMQRQPGGTPDQPGSRQHDAQPNQFSIAPPVRARTQVAAASGPSSLATGSVDGLNVIV